MVVGSKELAKLLKKGVKALIDEPEVKPKAKDKPKSKAGRKRKPRGVKPATPAQKAGARKAGVPIKDFRALSEAEQKKWMKVDKPKAAPKVKRTRKEDSELKRLTAQQKEEMDADLRPKKTATGTRRMKLTPEGLRLFNAGEFDEIINNPKKYITHGFDAPLRPKGTEVTKAQLAKMKKGSPDDKAQAIREMLNDPGSVVGTPVQVSPQLRGKASKGDLDEMEKELKELGGFEITEGLKGGGRLKYYKKGGRIKKSFKKPRGVGKALRGYGRAMGRG